MKARPASCGHRGTHLRRRIALPSAGIALGALLPLLMACRAAAVEQAEQFVDGLRERGLHELALDYLDQLEHSSLADAALQGQIPYLRAVTQIDAARRHLDPARRSELLTSARDSLDQFAAAYPDSSLGAAAQLHMATLLFEQGQQASRQADQVATGSDSGARRDARFDEARRLLNEARDLFEQSAEFYESELERLAGDLGVGGDDSTLDRRQESRGRLAQLRVLAAQALYELGQTHRHDPAEFRRLNEQAAEELAALHDQYPRWLVGFYARLYEGRCYQALGDLRLALGCYEDVLTQPSVLPAFRKLIASAYRHQAECFLAEDKFDAAIQSCRSWLDDARGSEPDAPEWLAVRFRLAEALEQKARSLREGSAEARRLMADARDAYRVVSMEPGEFQIPARNAAAALGQSERAELNEVSTFREAFTLGKEAMASANSARLALPTAERNNPQAVIELQAQIQQDKEEARRYFRLAATLVDDEVDLETLNELRYYLCWLYWESEDYYRAAVLGEFLARRYADHPAAAAAAKIAMASYERLYNLAIERGAGRSDTEFEARRMAEVAEFIARRWPDTDGANVAFGVLAGYAIRNHRMDEAQRLLEQVPADHRPLLEMQLGNALWGEYLDRSRGDDMSSAIPLREEAVKYLESGFRSVNSTQDVSETAAMAALYLVQAYLEMGQYDEAIRLLEDGQVGPLELVSRGHPAAARPAYAVEVYKAAMRAYVSATPPQVERAMEAVDALDDVAERSPLLSDDQLTRIYIGLSATLQEQIAELRDAGRDAEAARVSDAFAKLLQRISTRPDAGSWASRLWLAQTHYEMGVALADPNAARQFFEESRDAFQQLTAAAEADPDFAPSSEAVVAVKKQLGDSLRQLGKYQQALDVFSSILKDQETLVSVQIAAAYAYQERAKAGDPKWFERAIYGGYKVRSTGNNRIWGWLKIAQVAQRAARANPKYRDWFFEARLNAARCRYLAGTHKTGTARSKDLATAKQSILSVMQLYPDLGGPPWRDRFDQLLKRIQKEAGDKPVGLSEYAAESS